MIRHTVKLLPLMLLCAPLHADNALFKELSEPLFEYCQKIETSALLGQEASDFLGLCNRSKSDAEAAAEGKMEPKEYLASLRSLDKAHHKNLWELHLLLRSVIEKDDVETFNRIVAVEERSIFQMNGLLPHALEFMARHEIEIPYYINPNASTGGAFQYAWNPEKSVQ